MPTLQQFPAEILKFILDYIFESKEPVKDQQNLLQYQLACKSWYPIAQKLLYTNVTFNSVQAIRNYLNTLNASNQDLKSLANTFYFNYIVRDLDQLNESDLFDELAAACPNLKRVETLALQDDDSLLRTLSKAGEGHWALERIPESNIWGESAVYSEAVITFAKTLTLLTLVQFNRILLLDEDPHPHYYTQIINQTLPRLETLEIIMAEGITLSRFDELIQVCPVLHTLHFFYRSRFKNKKKLYDRYSPPPDHFEEELELSFITPRPDIKVCEGFFIIDAAESMRYFMHKLPKLERLNIEIDSFFDRDTYDDVDFDSQTMVSFLKYISKVPSFCVENFCTQDTVATLMSFIAETNFDGIIEIDYDEDNDSAHDEDDFFFWRDGNPKLKFENFCNPDNTIQQKITAIFPIDPEQELDPTQVTPHLEHIKMLMRMKGLVKHLSLGSGFQYRTSIIEELNRSLARCYGIKRSDNDTLKLNRTFTTCSSLKVLSLHSLELMHCENNKSKGISSSMEDLYVKECNLSTDILPELSARLPNLKNFVMNRCTMMNDADNVIEIYMPEIAFNTISCIDPLLYDIRSSEFYLKLKTDSDGILYFKSNGYELNTCTDQEYNDSLENLNIVLFDIHCKSLDYLEFKIGKTEKKKFAISSTS